MEPFQGRKLHSTPAQAVASHPIPCALLILIMPTHTPTSAQRGSSPESLQQQWFDLLLRRALEYSNQNREISQLWSPDFISLRRAGDFSPDITVNWLVLNNIIPQRLLSIDHNAFLLPILQTCRLMYSYPLLSYAS